ncbi:cytochrome b [Oryzifoliimicrobium ureilyticus]|uniref:cytochrome b n=1 Tax=Oryzifoliimicrobium ureilyticus TaxID=3113724 RepID=UPI003075FCCD
MAMNIQAGSVDGRQRRYNGGMILLHWLTAFLVVFLFLTAQIWDFVERGGALRHGLQSLHVACGLLLALVFLARVTWRILSAGDLPPKERGIVGLLAEGAHYLLYLGLVAQIVLGFLWRWAQGKAVDVFGYLSIPDFVGVNTDYRHMFGELHENLAWAIIALAGVHAVAAIYHHAVLKDGVLLKMMPSKP